MTDGVDSIRGPGARAASAPEATDASAAVHAVGVGPGTPEFVTGRASSLLDRADVVVGFQTVLDVVADATDATLLACGYDDQDAVLDRFAARVDGGAAGVAVLMGDPNVSGHQFLGRVERAVAGPVRVVPGISSVQVAASRARTPLDRSTVVSLHRRGSLAADLDRLAADAGRRHLLVLPRPYDWMPEAVAAHLVESGADPTLPALVCERLTLPDEAVDRRELGDLAADAGGEGPAATAFSDLSVVVVRAPDAVGTATGATEGDT